MTKIEMLETLTRWAKDYREDAAASINRNSHMNEIRVTNEISQTIIDALLVDFINFAGRKMAVDYALYTSDLEKAK